MKYEWISMRSKVLIAGLPNVMIYSSTFANDYDIVPPSTLRNKGDGGRHGSRIKLMTEKSCTTIHCCRRNHSSCRTVWMVWDRVSRSWEARKSKSKVVNLRGRLAPIKAGMIAPIETRMIVPIEARMITPIEVRIIPNLWFRCMRFQFTSTKSILEGTYIVIILLKLNPGLLACWRTKAAKGILKAANAANANELQWTSGGTRLFHMVLRDRVGWPSVGPGCPVDRGWWGRVTSGLGCVHVGVWKSLVHIGEDERTTLTFLVAHQILWVEEKEDRHLCFCSNENCRGLKNK